MKQSRYILLIITIFLINVLSWQLVSFEFATLLALSNIFAALMKGFYPDKEVKE